MDYSVCLFCSKDLEHLLQPEGMECGVAMIRGGYNRESSERHDACINGRVAFEVEQSSMQGFKKEKNSLVLCSLIRIFSLCEKILTPKGMSVAMQSLARKRK